MKTLRWFGVIGEMVFAVVLLVACFGILLGLGRGAGAYGWGVFPWAVFGLPLMAIMGVCMLVFWFLSTGGTGSRMRPFGCARWGSWMPWQGESPLDALEKRFAQGELTKEQFEEMKRDLRQ